MEFGEIKNLWWLLLLPFVMFLFYSGYKKRDNILKSIRFKIIYKRNLLRYILMTAGIGIILFALTDIKIFKGYTKIDKKSLDIYVLIDVSKSMNSDDVKPSRIERAKGDILRLIDTLKGDRIGFIPFSSDAYIQMPLTDDYDVAKMFLDAIDTEMIGGGGTNLSKALLFAKESFDKGTRGEKVVIVLSDGEEHDPDSAAAASKMENIRIYTVGFGTDKGSLVPEYDENGTNIGYKKDESGNYVVSKINSQLLRDIAEKSGGKFYMSTIEGFEADKIVESINMYKRESSKQEDVREFNHVFQYILGIGMLFFLGGYFLKNKVTGDT